MSSKNCMSFSKCSNLESKRVMYFKLRHQFAVSLRETLLGRRQANLCFHFAGSGENLPDITKSRDTSMDNKKQNSFLFTSCHFTLR